MAAFNLVNRLKLNNSFFTIDLNPHLLTPTEEEDEDMEDSFFDLNILSDSNLHNVGEDEDGEIQNLAKPVDKSPLHFPELGLAFSTDFISSRKILPIGPISKPQSPTSILKSAPSFSLFVFKKQRSMAAQKMEERTCRKLQKPESRQKMEREHAFIKCNTKNSVGRNPEESQKYPSKKRFSKEAMNKYLKLIKPLYSKVSKMYSEKEGSFQNLSPAGKHFGKSKSATGLSFRALNRRDDSSLLQVDGIQSAILHCKRSYDSSRDSTSSSSSFCSDYHSLEENPRISSSRDILGH